MDRSGRKGTRAGGFILFVGIMGGAVIGGLFGQPSAGLIAGGGLGVLIALAIWLRDRRYTG
jgi:fucose permease